MCENDNVKLQYSNTKQKHHKNVEIFPCIWIKIVFWNIVSTQICVQQWEIPFTYTKLL
jgi:hypothetical protein